MKCYGPVTQRDLLFGLGIQERLEKLVEECETEEQAERVAARASDWWAATRGRRGAIQVWVSGTRRWRW